MTELVLIDCRFSAFETYGVQHTVLFNRQRELNTRFRPSRTSNQGTLSCPDPAAANF
jgi:hypothetical protein